MLRLALLAMLGLAAMQVHAASELESASTPAADAVTSDSEKAQSQAPVPQDRKLHYLIGGVVNANPDFFGPTDRQYGIRPVLALEWGRLRLSQGGGYGLMGRGRRDRGRGLEGTIAESDRFNLSLSLNIDRGRGAASTDRLRNVPDVPTTLRLRTRARYYFTDRWTGSLAVSQDILGKGGGLDADSWLSYAWHINQATLVTAGFGASWGNGPYMRSQFGLPASAAVASGFPAYRPSAGLYQTEVGLDISHALSRHWVIFGGIRYSKLHGDAKRSPLVYKSSGMSMSAGLAWRN